VTDEPPTSSEPGPAGDELTWRPTAHGRRLATVGLLALAPGVVTGKPLLAVVAAPFLALLALGLWWLVTGRQLPWMNRSGAVPVRIVGQRGRPLRSGLAGLAWIAWPCAALQGALLLSALASSPQGGAFVMGAFAIGSMPALAVGPWAWGRWRATRGGAAASTGMGAAGLRVAGLGLVIGSGWALTHGLWERVAAWCVGA